MLPQVILHGADGSSLIGQTIERQQKLILLLLLSLLRINFHIYLSVCGLC